MARHYRLSPTQFSDEHLRDYFIGLHQRGLSRRMVNVAISALRVLCGDLLKCPVLRIEECLLLPRKVTRCYRVYSWEELRSLRDWAFFEGGVWRGLAPV